MNAQEHWGAARDFLNVVDAGAAAGRPLLPSELMWGAATHAIRAYARWRGWRVGKSQRLIELLDLIVADCGDASLPEGFGKAGLLHANFYNGFMDDDAVAENQAIVRNFAERVLAMVPADNPAISC